MANDLLNALRENLAQSEQLGDTEWAKRLRKRIKEEEARDEKSVGQMTKAELQAEAAARGVEVDSSANKADIVEALEGSEE